MIAIPTELFHIVNNNMWCPQETVAQHIVIFCRIDLDTFGTNRIFGLASLEGGDAARGTSAIKQCSPGPVSDGPLSVPWGQAS